MCIEDLIMRDNTVIKPKDVIFEDIAHEPSDVTMTAILNKCLVHSWVTVVRELFSISQTALSMSKSQPFKECKIFDEKDAVKQSQWLTWTPSRKQCLYNH